MVLHQDVQSKISLSSSAALSKMQDDLERFIVAVYTPEKPTIKSQLFSQSRSDDQMLKLKARDSEGTSFDVISKGSDTPLTTLSLEDISKMNEHNGDSAKLKLYGGSNMTKALRNVQEMAFLHPEFSPSDIMELSLKDPDIPKDDPESIRNSIESLSSSLALEDPEIQSFKRSI